MSADDIYTDEESAEWLVPKPSAALHAHNDNYVEREERELANLRWITTQPALYERMDLYGLGTHVLQATPELRAIREGPRLRGAEAVAAMTVVIQALEAGAARTLGIEEEDFLTRRDGIQAGSLIDLPSSTVRAIEMRIANYTRRQIEIEARARKNAKRRSDGGYGEREDIDDAEMSARVAARLIDQLRCGQTHVVEVEDLATGEVSADEDIAECEGLGCSRLACFVGWRDARKRDATKKIKAVLGHAAEMGERPIWIVLRGREHLWRHEPPLNIRGLNGERQPRRHWSPVAPTAMEWNLTDRLLSHHQKVRTSFLGCEGVRDKLGALTAYFTEVSYLTPSDPGQRFRPHPHSNIMSSVAFGMSMEDLERQLNELVPEGYGMSIMITDLIPEAKTPSYVGGYVTKLLDVTEAVASENAEGNFGYILAPEASDVFSVMDERTLIELIDTFDFGAKKVFSGWANKRSGKTSSHSILAEQGMKAWKRVYPNSARSPEETAATARRLGRGSPHKAGL